MYELDLMGEKGNGIRQITKGKFDVTGIAGQHENTLIVSRTDMNHAAELYAVDISTGNMNQLTHVNDEAYRDIAQCEIKERYTELEPAKNFFHG